MILYHYFVIKMLDGVEDAKWLRQGPYSTRKGAQKYINQLIEVGRKTKMVPFNVEYVIIREEYARDEAHTSS